MRANWTPTLQSWVRRADPKARLILEAQAIAKGASGEQADVRHRQSQWLAADSTVGFDATQDGTVRLSNTPAILVDASAHHPNSWGGIIDPNSGFAFNAAEITLTNQPPSTEISSIEAYLDPAFGGAQEVLKWEMQLWAVEAADVVDGQASGTLLLFPIGAPLRVTAPNTAGVVTFDFSTRGFRPLPAFPGPMGMNASTFLVTVRGLKANDVPAANVAWGVDNAFPGAFNGTGCTLTGMTYLPKSGGTWNRTPAGALPDLKVKLVSVVANATLSFTGGGNKLVFPNGAPTGVIEFTCRGYTPSASSLIFQAKVLIGDPWVTVVDGSTIGAGLPTDVALAKSANYFFQIIFNSDPQHLVSPILAEFGAIEAAITSFDGLLGPDPRVQWTLDPVTLSSEIAEAEFDVLKDGEVDYNSAIETLLATNDIGSIELRLWIGHPDLPRSLWMLVDGFQIDDPQCTEGGKLTLIAVSPLQQLRQVLPVLNTATGTRQALVYTNKTFQFIYDDLFVGQLGIAGRLYGPRLEDTTQLVSKTITDGYAKQEVDAICFLSGGSCIPSQARMKYVRIMNDASSTTQGKQIAATIPWNEIAYGMVTPGFRQRAPIYQVPYGYDYANGKYTAEADGLHASALAKLTQARIDAPQKPDDVVSRWIPSPNVIAVSGIARVGQVATVTTAVPHGWSTGQLITHAGAGQAQYNGSFPITVIDATHYSFIVVGSPATPATGTITATAGLANFIANRQAQALGAGIITMSVELNYMHPELELGDVIAIQNNGRLAVKDPNTGAAIRGRIWAVGVIVGQHDALGRRFTIWVRSYNDLGTNVLPDRTGFAGTGVESMPTVQAFFRHPGQSPGSVEVRLGSTPASADIYYVVQDAGDPVPALEDPAYALYNGAFLVSQLDTTDKQVSAYAVVDGRFSAVGTWRIDADDIPEVSLLLTESPANTLLVRWVPDDDVAAVRVYVKSTNWPVSNVAITSLTSVGTLATAVTATPHNLVTGDTTQVSGATQANYNVFATCTVVDPYTFRYTIVATTSPATGSPVLTSARNPLDQSLFKGEFRVAADAGGFDPAGAPIAGGTSWSDSHFYSGTETAGVILIPISRDGVAGPRAFGRYGPTGATLAFWSTSSVARTRDGTDCTTRAQNTIKWSTLNATDPNNDMKLYRRKNGGGWQLLTTINTPVATTSYVDTIDDWYSAGGAPATYDYRLDLLDTVPNVIDSLILSISYPVVEC